MTWIVTKIRWIMITSGLLTTTMIYAAIAPQAALQSTFGETLSGPLADLVVRNWGVLIGVIGGMLIYGAFNPLQRPLILVAAAASKATFIALVLVNRDRYLSAAGIPIAVDAVMIALFAWYLAAARSAARGVPDAARLSV